jgi:uncharacterized protein (DUF4415 family)
MIENKNAIRTDWIDEDDAPELSDAFFEQADEYRKGVLVRQGKDAQMKAVTKIELLLENDIISAFKARGQDWQANMTEVLREWVDCHPI